MTQADGTTDRTVGFVGLGAMGRAMAGRLLGAGYGVRVWNRSPESVATLVAQGAEAAPDPAGAFACEVVFSMLADDRAVELLLDPALLRGARPGLVHVNMATVSVELAKRAAAVHADHGVGYVAAPVLGRPPVAEAGQLTVLAAGAAKTLDRVEPLLSVLGRRVWRLGAEPHLANAHKLAANYLIACAIGAMAEAAALVDAVGGEPADLIGVITDSILPGPVHTGYGTMIADRRYEPAGFRAALGLKDVNLALTAGAEVNVPLPLGGVLRDALLDALAHGDGDRDWAVLAEVARRHAGLA
ncbi:NAD(P)-dependent oxidoreductase [Streptacidiphilus jiangxiensis]|uniref:3-hydroxyisobutyrate dehydrogenase n=1 Tax=Streptacidiphilus jiangxiensis TaxID=235985 RepID=A0A1H7V943_STRJI|nr:NAD(P)-dependent oxidoreductase [Streptacidiphilus jiangxiensis]SEM05771.1 3-hydroxyisobutyrate dehydrogenase [Streptacidiphilus jiangxiensis]